MPVREMNPSPSREAACSLIRVRCARIASDDTRDSSLAKRAWTASAAAASWTACPARRTWFSRTRPRVCSYSTRVRGTLSPTRWAVAAREASASSAAVDAYWEPATASLVGRAEEHTSELQSRGHLVCRRLLEQQNTTDDGWTTH